MRDQLVETLRALGGPSTTHQILQRMPVCESSVFRLVSRMYQDGTLDIVGIGEREGQRGPRPYLYWFKQG